MSSPALGVLAALASPLMMVIGFVIWDKRWTGSAFSLNVYKNCLASMVLLVTVFAIRRMYVPVHDFSWLCLSSLIGIVIGDNLWLIALKSLGARRVIVVETLKPFVGALLGVAILDEHLNTTGWISMIVCTLGVFLASWYSTDDESRPRDDAVDDMVDAPTDDHITVTPALGPAILNRSTSYRMAMSGVATAVSGARPRKFSKGYLAASVNVCLDAYGFVLTKQYGGDLNTFEINLLRFGMATAVLAPMMLIRQVLSTGPCTSEPQDDRSLSGPAATEAPAPATDGAQGSQFWYRFPSLPLRTHLMVSLGVLFVTYLCPVLSIYALSQLEVGVTMTLLSVAPIYSIPVVWFMKRESTSFRAICGTAMAVGGVVLLTLEGREK